MTKLVLPFLPEVVAIEEIEFLWVRSNGSVIDFADLKLKLTNLLLLRSAPSCYRISLWSISDPMSSASLLCCDP